MKEELPKAYLQDSYLDKRRAAEYLSMSVRTLASHKDIPRFKVGGKVLFKRSELDLWMQFYRIDQAQLKEETNDLRQYARECRKAAKAELGG